MANNLNESPLFSTVPVSDENGCAPVIVVGLPRSGSSFLSYVLSQIEDWYVFDDLYFFRTVQGMGVNGPLTKSQLDRSIDFLGWQIRARIKHEKFNKPKIRFDDVDLVDEALRKTYCDRDVLWHELQREWLTRLARHHGCSRWGYKTPQDFMNTNMLNRLYPGAKYVFLYRDPRDVLASYKYIGGRRQDGNPGQYHPLVYAMYWRMAAKKMKRLQAELPDRVCEVKFENLVEQPNDVGQQLARFLDSRLTRSIERKQPNSSFNLNGNGRNTISNLEVKICESVIGDELTRKGYEFVHPSFKSQDIVEFCAITIRFFVYQAKRLIGSRAKLVSVVTFLRFLFVREKTI